ncbi:uncharacterized protein LOC143265299 [Megachile rotundata]|uniref:uncharacterized protein LOC143265299 n=1 Tax=Megachile rotundata TaxID=143995 RepID=UPI003FD4B883
MESLKSLVAERGAIKSKLTRFRKFVETSAIESDILAFEKRVRANEGLYDKFDGVQSRIETIVVGTENEETHLQERESFEDIYFCVLSNAERRLNSVRGVQTPVPSQAIGAPSAAVEPMTTRLPVIKLPTFNGDFGQWIRFRDTFTSLVHNCEKLTDIDRFNYLVSALSGPAARILESFSVSAANYALAWSRLKERYENPKALIDHHVNALFDVPPVRKQDGESLSKFIDTAVNNVRALEGLLTPVELWEAFISAYLSRRIDSASLDEWERKIMEAPNRPGFTEFAKFLEHRSQYLARKDANKAGAIAVPSNLNKDNRLRTDNRVVNRAYHPVSHVTSQHKECPLCKGDHELQYCSKLLGLAFPQRHETIKRLQVCFNCLMPGHSIKNCTRGKCRICGKKHHTVLHREEAPATTEIKSTPAEPSTSHVVQSCLANSTEAAIECTVLSTAIVFVIDDKGNRHKCRALLDVGSQAHFVTEEFCQRFNLRRRPVDMSVAGLSGAKSTIEFKTQIEIASQGNSFHTELSCLVIKKITETMPNIPLNKVNIPVPPGVIPADPEFQQPGHIDLLIGAGLFWRLLCIGQHKVGLGNLVWQKTRLGWVLGGSLNWPENRKSVQACHAITNAQLDASISRFWNIEEIDSGESTSIDSNECEIYFKETTVRNSDGRYIVSLPFNDRVSELGNSHEQAQKRLLNIERRFKRDSTLRSQYIDFMQEYIDLGHMSIVQDETVENSNSCYYLPHHAVFKSSSTTTKIRVVFDGSAKTSSGLSLNDAQLVGPTVQSDLVTILIRFRKHRIVLSADIEKMYRQVLVASADRKYQRILWRSTDSEPIKTYELNTVTYGTASASFLATRALRQVGQDYAQSFPRASSVIRDDFYVDDLLTGCETVEEAKELQESLNWVLAQAGFCLRKWASNDSRIVHNNSNENTVVIKTAEKDPKTLGLFWSVNSDQLSYTIADYPTNRVTKRVILSEIAKIFDPLGLIGPIIVRAKLLMQELWQLNIGWDVSLPQEIHTRWCSFRTELRDISFLAIPRRVLVNSNEYLELHGFSDASEKAYGAAIYLRARTGNTTWGCRLLCAKTRVAPLKTISLPRLELCGALLLAQLVFKVRNALRVESMKEYCWTDSTIVLAWIRDEPCRWKTFVANRVSEIQRLTSSSNWQHVVSSDNPADLLSRGATPLDLKNNSLWWCGPTWLSHDIELVSSIEVPIADIPEQKRVVSVNLAMSDTSPSLILDLVSRYSSYMKLLRVIAYCLRFSQNTRVKGFVSQIKENHSRYPPSASEIAEAEIVLIRGIQSIHFSKEIALIASGKTVDKHSPLISLNPFIDERGLVRVGGRLENAQLKYEQKHPLIIPKSGPLAILLINHEHLRHLHAGCQQTLAALHSRFWILSGKRLIKKVLRQCLSCFRTRPTSVSYKMGDLPADRVVPARAFATCGVDYAGPFLIKEAGRSRVARKCYICLFVCFTTKAIHIELAVDLSTDAFLNCLHRFIARRGRCNTIYSDNGRNFLGARNELQELGTLLGSSSHSRQIIDSLAKEHIDWRFIPPNAPHFGGLWERGVRSVKTHLKRVVGEQRLTFEEFYTILTQIEACLNSRPLSPLSHDPNDLDPLTPGHFLIGDALMALPQPDITNLNQGRLNRYQLIQQMVQHFWRRWQKEYLHGLQQRHKWKTNPSTIVKKDSLVLVKEDNLPPTKWRLGRITELHPGSDGVIRVVTLRTADGILKRPVTKICPLPVIDSDQPTDPPFPKTDLCISNS